MSSQLTLLDTPSAISLPASADGHSLPESPDGPRTASCGPARVRASRSASPAKAPAPMTSGICGPTCSDSLQPVALQSGSESKSQPPQSPVTRGKTCKGCGERKPYSEFYADSKGRTRANCCECLKASERARKAGTKQQRSESHSAWRKKNPARALIGAAKHRASQKGLAFDLDQWVPNLEERFARGVCEMTGLPLNTDGGRTWDSPSIDRIDPSEGYTITNVRVVLFALNVMMNTWGEGRVLEVADALRAKMLEADQHPLADWEANLKRRLSRLGSTECFLTWKASVTPAGRPLSRLVPSMGRTVEIVCGSSPSEMALWVTASARDWKDTPGMAATRSDGRSRVDQLPRQVAAALWATPTVAQPGGSPEAFLARKAALNGACGVSLTDLRMQAQVACWPTPTASLADKGVRSTEGAIREAARSHGPDLAAVTAAAMWGTPTAASKLRSEEWLRSTSPSPAEFAAAIQRAHGATPHGSSATTEKPGALNPQFVCWLMGFSPEWDACAPTETRSSRRSRPK